MAGDRDYPGAGVRLTLGLVGLGLLGLSFVAREHTGYAVASLLAGLVLIVLASVGDLLTRLKIGATELEFRQRAASAEAADTAVSSAEVSQRIASAEEVPPSPSPQDPDVIGTLNYIAGNMALNSIFDWTTASGEPLEDCQLRLYLLDSTDNVLRPVLAPTANPEDATPWAIGKGATGAAYESGEYVIATGAAVSDGTYGLSTEEQERFRTLAAVAAAPVYNAGGRVIGVVTASTSALTHRLDTDDGRRDHTLAALLVSRVLVELLQWFDDDA